MAKKKANILKVVRVILALAVFIPVLLFFCDFRNLLPDGLHSLLHLQIIPAIFAGAAGVLVFLTLLTLLFGRVYCSVICPAGVLQDIFNRIACIGKKKKNGSLRFKYHRPLNVLRYVILGVTAILAVFGLSELCLLLDPYSNFGRIATNLFRPVAVWTNNLLAEMLSKAGNYTLYNVSFRIASGALVAAVGAFAVFAVMAYYRGRLFCNSICPVGTLLSIVSRYSLFRLTVNHEQCNKCGICERACKAEAITSKAGEIDMSRCVGCFNCLSSCSKSALKFRFAPLKARAQTSDFSPSRRSFMVAGAAIAGSMPAISRAATAISSSTQNNLPVTPPGSISIDRFKKLCTGCHLCVVRCPSKVLHPAGLQYGFGYMLKPYMSYHNSYCNYSCTVCSNVCPTGAIKPVTEEEKAVTQVGIANFYIDRCIVNTEETDCGACSEHCPTQAVHMIEYKGTLTIPKVEPELCIGCGGCESICPVRPERAIIIISNPVHQTAEKPKEEEIQQVDVDDFGF